MTRIKSKSHPHAALPDAGSASLISDARLIEIYAAMLKCRMLRKFAGAAKLRALGTEAVAAAVSIDLSSEDRIVSSAPHLMAALAKGVPLATLLPPRNSAHTSERDQALCACGVLAAPAADATAHFAAGIAFAGKLAKLRAVTIVFLDSTDAKSQGREIFDFALAHDLPVIFVRQAAGLRAPDPARSRSASTRSLPSGLPVIPVDGNDAVAVYRVAHEALAHARRGSGPTLVDCVSVHLPGERKQDSDCIARMEHYLAAKGLRPDRIHSKVTGKFTRSLEKAAASSRRGGRGRRLARSK